MALIFFAFGCEKNSEYQTINLEEKMEPQTLSVADNNSRLLRVAVAAMVSPKETLIYYEELLHFSLFSAHISLHS